MKHSFWHLDLFGGLRAVRVNQPDALPIENFRTQKAASLLAFLAFYRQAHRREVLAEMFWPESDALKGRNSLRVALSGLRDQLLAEGIPEDGALLIKRETLCIAPSVTTDVAMFRTQLQNAHFESDESSRLQKLEEAAELVRGPLLRGFYDDWISGEAARLEDEFLSALRQIITAYESRQDFEKALDAARRGTIVAPLREGVVRDLVRLGFACGQEENVRAEFDAFRRRVERVGGAMPLDWNEFVRRATQAATPRSSLASVEPIGQTLTTRNTSSASTIAPVISGSNWHPTQETIKPLPQSNTSFIGREGDIETLTAYLRSSASRLVTIVGPGGAGKTRLALETVRLLSAPSTTEATASAIDSNPLSATIWLPLANLPSSRLLPGALLYALGATAFKEDTDAVAQILRQLSEESKHNGAGSSSLPSSVEPRLLLVVDNCEHLDKSAAQFISDLLTRVPTLTVLATSRSALGIAGEHSYRLDSLDASSSAPTLSAATLSTELQSPSDAVRLFVERAQSAQPQFELDAQNAQLISQICARLDGLPLAIEIVAARVAQFTLEQIALGLGIQSAVLQSTSLNGDGLATGSRNRDGADNAAEQITSATLSDLSAGKAPKATDLIQELGLLDWMNPNLQAAPRHSSLRAAIEWSSDQLSPAIARFWSRLSVFHESFSLEAAVEICEEPYASVYLQILRDASLLGTSGATHNTSALWGTGDAREVARSVWLQSLREFAADVLSSEDKERLEARHADYYLRWAVQMSPLLESPSTTREQRLMDAEAVNIRSALQWLLDHDIEGALRMVNALCWYWEQVGQLVEGRLAVETALERSRISQAAFEAEIVKAEGNIDLVSSQAIEGLRARAQALEGAGKMGNMVADHEAAKAHLPEALRLFELLKDERGVAGCLYAMGFNTLRRGDFPTAKKLCQQSLELTRRLGDMILLRDALYNLSMVLLMTGDYSEVRRLSAERLALCRNSGDRRGLAMSLENLGLAALFEGDLGSASTYFSECLTAFEALEDKPSVARALWGLGQVAVYSQRLNEARDHFLRSSSLMRATHNLWAMPYLLESFGALAVAQKQWSRAALLLGGADGLRERQGEPIPSLTHQGEFDQLCERTRHALGEKLFEYHWTQGRAMERSQLLNLAESFKE